MIGAMLASSSTSVVKTMLKIRRRVIRHLLRLGPASWTLFRTLVKLVHRGVPSHMSKDSSTAPGTDYLYRTMPLQLLSYSVTSAQQFVPHSWLPQTLLPHRLPFNSAENLQRAFYVCEILLLLNSAPQALDQTSERRRHTLSFAIVLFEDLGARDKSSIARLCSTCQTSARDCIDGMDSARWQIDRIVGESEEAQPLACLGLEAAEDIRLSVGKRECCHVGSTWWVNYPHFYAAVVADA